MGMGCEDLDGLVSEAIANLLKPMSNSMSAEMLSSLCRDQYASNMQIVESNIHELSSRMQFNGDLTDNKVYENILENIASDQKKHAAMKDDILQSVSSIKSEVTMMKRDLQTEQQTAVPRLTAHHKQLEKEKATFSLYHRLCGDMRLDSEHAGPEVRGVVSREPTTTVTFSLRSDQLTPARLTDLLWHKAARRPDTAAPQPAT